MKVEKEKRVVKNEIEEFFGIDKPLFKMNELAGDDIKRFVDRG